MKKLRPAVRVVLGVAVLLGVASACGRTKLYGSFPCDREGKTTPCEDECGEGVLVCEAGFWSACRVPKAVEACENACGKGEKSCENSTWSECVVPEVKLECENNCGPGLALCKDGVLGNCEVPTTTRECANKCGTGFETCENDAWFGCTAPAPLPPVLAGTVRDFHVTHPDFERESTGAETGLVQNVLGSDGKPVYNGGPSGTISTTGRTNFDQWFRDVAGVNVSTSIEHPLAISGTDNRLYRYENTAFFPIDDQLYGNEGNPHNYHFTFEASGSFVYQGGEVFRFTGDDDVWVFVNDRLVIDLGGTHVALAAEVYLDDVAAEIGISIGGKYPLKMFFAERHTVESNFILETSIADLGPCP